MPVPDEPMLFMCAPSAIIADGEEIRLDNAGDRIDFEAEIGIVVGTKARNVAAGDAAKHILGHTCANDVSNRVLQKKDGQFTRARSFDTYKPGGPCIETELDPDNVDIKLWQNGELRQPSNTSDMIFPIARIFEFVSGIMTLLPGDLIIAGTPSGVGPMASGDEIVVEIDKIGRLRNTVARIGVMSAGRVGLPALPYSRKIPSRRAAAGGAFLFAATSRRQPAYRSKAVR